MYLGNYAISVVTPYHNVTNEMFDECVKGMMNQSLGFENIEWVVVLHNSDEAHVNYVRSKLQGYKNVVLKELHNDCHTASSPRNVGIDLATSDYISFLDGDDTLRPNILEQVLGYFKKTMAQIVIFRREYTLEFPDMVPISETVPWDTTREMILLDVKSGIDNRLYNDFPFFITNRVFERKFLNENNIRFDDDMLLSEDCYFNLEAIHFADKICILPQLIGYSYFINSKSILSAAKTDEEIICMTENVQRIIERALDYGMYANNIIIPISFALSRYLASPNVSMKTRVKVKDIMQPYLDMTTPIPTGRFAEPFNSLMNILPFELLLNIKRFEDTSKNIALNGLEMLSAILKENEDTHFGKRYHFSDILTPRGYQSQVPLSTLKTYQPMIDIERNICDSRIYLKVKPSWYIKMLNDMLVPVSAKQAEGYADAFFRQLHGDFVLVWSEDDPPIIPSNNGVYISSVCNISMSEYRKKYRVNLNECARQFVVPYEIVYNMDMCSEPDANYIMNRIYLKLLLAVANRNVDQIVLFDSFDCGSLRDSIAANIKEMIEDIRAGKLLGNRKYHKAYMRIIDSMLHSDSARADELLAIAERPEGFTLHDIWKNLSEITVIAVHPTTNNPSEFEGTPIHCRLIASEFGVIGTATANDGVYTLNREGIFYEFIPFGSDKPLLAEVLRPGDKVRPVVTTNSGLYRIPLTFAMEITGFENGNILFRPCIQ